MKVIVAGSRTYNDYEAVAAVLDQERGNITRLISGGAKGPDQLALQWARANHIPTQIHMADWDLYAQFAGMIRNEQMARRGDMLIAFWDGKSRGTANMLWCMDTLHKPVIVIEVA